MTDAQRKWLDDHPDYGSIGKPRTGVRFRDCGTLYGDGTFEKLEPLKPIVLREGCFGVGVQY